MKKININEIKDGDILYDDAINSNGVVFLAADTKLSKRHIPMLSNLGIVEVVIKDENELKKKKTIIEDKTDEVDIKLTLLYHKTVNNFKSMYKRASEENCIEIDEMDKILTPIMENTLKNNNILSTFRKINRELGEYTYKHCINVGILSSMLGKWLGYSEEEIKELGMAGFFHDIGKSKVSPDIINKKGSLNSAEFEIIKLHPTYGHEILKNSKNISPNIMLGVYQHHERMDGSGYPNNTPGDKIHPYAKIIAVADVYDAMSSNRVYKDAESPFKVYDFLLHTDSSKLDVEIVTTFVKNISNFFVGNIVRLSSGEKGKIVMINPYTPTRPFIQTENKFIDLSKNYNVDIVNIL